MATCEAWIEHLQSRRNELLGLDTRLVENPLLSGGLSKQVTASAPVTSLIGQTNSLPSHVVVDNREMSIDGYTAEQPTPYNNNNAVAIVGNGGVRSGYQQNGILPTHSGNYKSPTGAGGGGGFVGNGIGAPRLISSNNIVAKTPSQDLVNVSTTG